MHEKERGEKQPGKRAAKEKGMIVIADIKRGDIGSTAARIFKCIFRKNSNWR